MKEVASVAAFFVPRDLAAMPRHAFVGRHAASLFSLSSLRKSKRSSPFAM